MSIQELLNPGLSKSLLDIVTGTLLCSWFALTAVLTAHTWPHPLVLVLLFAPAVGMVAREWGFASAMLGLASGVAVFCLTLFAPIGRLDVASPDDRTGLFWTVVCASLSAYVLNRPRVRNRAAREGGESC